MQAIRDSIDEAVKLVRSLTVLGPTEGRIFGAMFLYVALYRDAREMELVLKWAAWFRELPSAYGGLLFRVELTSDHFVVQSVTGHTWRVVPLSKLEGSIGVLSALS